MFQAAYAEVDGPKRLQNIKYEEKIDPEGLENGRLM